MKVSVDFYSLEEVLEMNKDVDCDVFSGYILDSKEIIRCKIYKTGKVEIMNYKCEYTDVSIFDTKLDISSSHFHIVGPYKNFNWSNLPDLINHNLV